MMKEILEDYLKAQSTAADVEENIKSFAQVLEKTMCYENDTAVVPEFMRRCKCAGISLCLEDMGIDCSEQSLKRMAAEIFDAFQQAAYDYSYIDGLDDYDHVDVILINIVKINRWAEVLFEKHTLDMEAQALLKLLTEEQKQALRQIPYKRIAFLGDSGMISHHWSSIAGYPDIIAAVLDYLGVGIEIINKGIGGNKSNQGLERLQRDILAHEPDLCFVCFGGNDSAWNKQANDFVIPLEAYRSNMQQIVRSLKQSHVEVVLGKPSRKTKYHTNESDYLKYLKTVEDIANEEAVRTYDAFSCFSDVNMVGDISEDGIHLSTAGQLVVCMVVVNFLTAVLVND